MLALSERKGDLLLLMLRKSFHQSLPLLTMWQFPSPSFAKRSFSLLFSDIKLLLPWLAVEGIDLFVSKFGL